MSPASSLQGGDGDDGSEAYRRKVDRRKQPVRRSKTLPPGKRIVEEDELSGEMQTAGRSFTSERDVYFTTVFAASKLLRKARHSISSRPDARGEASSILGGGSQADDGAPLLSKPSYDSISSASDAELGEDTKKCKLSTKGESIHQGFRGDLSEIWGIITDNPLNLLLLLVPVAIVSAWLDWGPVAVFILNFIAMMPLAALLGDFTEEVAAHTNQILGGLINATMGNTVEVVVALQALSANQFRVVQASLLGSVLSNMLLVLGCCFFFGGLRHKEQTFNTTSAVANMSLLLLTSLALVLPTPLAALKGDEGDVLMVSRFAGVCLLFMYLQLLWFQLQSHAYLFADEESDSVRMSFVSALLCLAGITFTVTILSDYLVASIDGFTEAANLSKTFVGVILLPIIGNAVEHVSAVSVALKNKMDLALGVAVGSATQISMLVVPIVVLAGWIMDKPMTLNFPVEEVVLYFVAAIIVATAASAGSSNWLLGSLLITAYVLCGLAFWVEKIDTT